MDKKVIIYTLTIIIYKPLIDYRSYILCVSKILISLFDNNQVFVFNKVFNELSALIRKLNKRKKKYLRM